MPRLPNASPPPYHTESAPLRRPHVGNDNVGPHQTYGAVEAQPCGLPSSPVRVQKSRRPSICLFLVLLAGLVSGYFLDDIWNSPVHEIKRLRWAYEESRHHTLREKWDIEAKAHDELKARMLEQERIWEKERLEHEKGTDGARQALSWDGPWPAEHCLRYATREYSARLTNVGLGLNPIEECYRKPVEIHGRQVTPSRCENHAISGQVTGRWTVDFNEASCGTFWSYIKDKGCVQPGVHRYETPLENLQWGDDWREMCSTTPAYINGVWHLNGPTSCVDWGKHGKWGIWMLEDRSCQ